MKQGIHDLVCAGIYLCAATLASGVVVVAGAAGLRTGFDMPVLERLASALGTENKGETRLNEAIRNAQEIKAAISTPIPPPEPLPPITHELAHGNLLPGRNHARAVKPISRTAQDAMAMEHRAPYGDLGPPRRTFVPPELHKVY